MNKENEDRCVMQTTAAGAYTEYKPKRSFTLPAGTMRIVLRQAESDVENLHGRIEEIKMERDSLIRRMGVLQERIDSMAVELNGRRSHLSLVKGACNEQDQKIARQTKAPDLGGHQAHAGQPADACGAARA